MISSNGYQLGSPHQRAAAAAAGAAAAGAAHAAAAELIATMDPDQLYRLEELYLSYLDHCPQSWRLRYVAFMDSWIFFFNFL